MRSIVELGFIILVLLQVHDSLERSESENRVSNNIYKSIGGLATCFRRMNGTHQIGCTSSMNGDVGVIHVVNEETEGFDVDWIASQGPHSPYIAVLYPSSFKKSILDRFTSSSRIKGILLLHRNDSTKIGKFSTDKSCPNRGYGFYRDPQKDNLYCPAWNDHEETNELLFRDWGFPIIYVQDIEEPKKFGIDSILDCYEKYNKPVGNSPREWPLCAAQLTSFMPAAKDSPTCLRRSQASQLSITPRHDCDPVGDRNLIASLIPSNHSTPYPNRSVIVIAARLDSASLFDSINPAADTVATALTAILTTLKQLHKIKEQLSDSQTIKNIYFILFNGEAFDYIGSSRAIYDMSLDKFPMDLDDNENGTFSPALLRLGDIKYYIELNQVALTSNEPYYIHQNLDSSSAASVLSPLIGSIIANGRNQNLNINPPPSSRPANWSGVPPSSLHSFLSNSSDFPGIVISNFETKFRNKYYNSIYDDYDEGSPDYKAAVQSIGRLATTVACTVEGLVNGNNAPCSISQDTELVEDIFECYIVNGKCQLFLNVSTEEMVPYMKKKPNFYVGVHRDKYDLLSLTSLTKNVLAYFQGDIVNRTKEFCHSDEKIKNLEYMYFNGSCYETTVTTTLAVSPAFAIKNYDWKSGQYSSWTESIWVATSLRIFLKPSFAHELTTFLCGLAVFGISFVLVGWISRKTDIIFPTRYIGYAPVSPQA